MLKNNYKPSFTWKGVLLGLGILIIAKLLSPLVLNLLGYKTNEDVLAQAMRQERIVAEQKKDNNINVQLQKLCDSINKLVPITVDYMTKIVRVSVPADRTLQTDYEASIDRRKYNIDKLSRITDSGLLRQFIANPISKEFKDSSVTIVSIYSDTTHKFLFKSVITPDRYKGL